MNIRKYLDQILMNKKTLEMIKNKEVSKDEIEKNSKRTKRILDKIGDDDGTIPE